MGCLRHRTITICPGSTLDRSSSVGTPSARARSEGSQDATKGTAARTAPTAPTPIVAEVRNLRRLRSTSSLATTMLSATYRLSAYLVTTTRWRIACRAYGTCARVLFPARGGRRIIHKPAGHFFRPRRSRAGCALLLAHASPGVTHDRSLEPRARFRGRLGGRGTGPCLCDRGAASGPDPTRWTDRPADHGTTAGRAGGPDPGDLCGGRTAGSPLGRQRIYQATRQRAGRPLLARGAVRGLPASLSPEDPEHPGVGSHRR